MSISFISYPSMLLKIQYFLAFFTTTSIINRIPFGMALFMLHLFSQNYCDFLTIRRRTMAFDARVSVFARVRPATEDEEGFTQSSLIVNEFIRDIPFPL